MPSVAARSSRMPFSSDSRPTKSTCGGSSGLADVVGDPDAARDHADVACAEPAGGGGQLLGRTDDDPCAPHELPRHPACAPRELYVRPPELEDEGLSCRDSGERRRKPVRVHEVGIPPPRGEPPASTKRGRAGEASPSRASASGSRRSRARTRARSAGTRRATRRPPRRPPPAGARPRRARRPRRRRPASADTTS